MGLVFLGVFMVAVGGIAWWDARRVEQHYRDGIFTIIKILDLPLADWEKNLRTPEMSEEEWFGFQRGYTQALHSALSWLDHPHDVPNHTNRLEPTPR